MDKAKIKELLEGPGLKPPLGVKPNFVDPPNQLDALLAVTSLCFIIATFCVAIRAWTRFYLMRTYGWEDYTCFIAYAGLITYMGLLLSPIFREHAAIHQWNIRGKDLQSWVKIANGVEITYIPTIFAAKLSILLLYLRLFVPHGRTKTWYTVQGLILFNALFYFANLPIEIWPCVPREKLWMPTKPGHCINNEAVFVAGGTINMVSDFAILAIPIVTVWRLQMSRRRRIGVSAIFAFGIFGCIASIMHLATSVPATESKDKIHYLFPVALWTLAEITSGILCSCAILVPTFLRHLLPKLSSSFSSLPHIHSPFHTSQRTADRSGSTTAVSRRHPSSFLPGTAMWASSHTKHWEPKSAEWSSSTDSELGMSRSMSMGMGPGMDMQFPHPPSRHHHHNNQHHSDDQDGGGRRPSNDIWREHDFVGGEKKAVGWMPARSSTPTTLGLSFKSERWSGGGGWLGSSKRSSARDSSQRSANPGATHSTYANDRLSSNRDRDRDRESRYTATTTRQSRAGDTIGSGNGNGGGDSGIYSRREKSLPASPSLPPTVKAVGGTSGAGVGVGANTYTNTSPAVTGSDAPRNLNTLTLPPNVAVAGTGPKVPRQEPGLGTGLGSGLGLGGGGGRGRDKEGKGEIRVETAWEVSR